MDFVLSVLSLHNIRRRLFDIQQVVNRVRERFKTGSKHLHIKVTHEVTVQLPADWKPRRERMKQQTTAA